jgi:hypothetical protein
MLTPIRLSFSGRHRAVTLANRELTHYEGLLTARRRPVQQGPTTAATNYWTRLRPSDSHHAGRGPLLHLSATRVSDCPKACQSPGYLTFSLDKDLEALTHPFGVDQCLELQPRPGAFAFSLPLIVEVREFIPLP